MSFANWCVFNQMIYRHNILHMTWQVCCRGICSDIVVKDWNAYIPQRKVSELLDQYQQSLGW